MKRLCVFCGSSRGANAKFAAAAQELGTLLARRRIALVYGGGNIGLMGIVANAVLSAGGEVIGVIPKDLAALELAHTGIQDLRVVGSMHERKALMADFADGFMALPGGFGTLEEFCEIVTWAQLGLHHKPCGLINLDGYFDHLISFLDHAVEERLLRPEHRAMVLVAPDPQQLLVRFDQYRPPELHKWIDRDST